LVRSLNARRGSFGLYTAAFKLVVTHAHRTSGLRS
jgi:hypothetical protein